MLDGLWSSQGIGQAEHKDSILAAYGHLEFLDTTQRLDNPIHEEVGDVTWKEKKYQRKVQ